MRLKVILTCCALPLMFGFGPAAVSNGDDVVGLEKKTWELWQKHDKAGFASLMDSDFINVDKHGVATKAQNVAEIDNLIKEGYELSDFQIHQINTDAIFLTYRAKLKGTYKGTRINGTYHVSSVWATRQGRWLNVLYHETKAD